MTTQRRSAVAWYDAEPAALQRERHVVPLVAPELNWDDDLASGGWRGIAPVWPFDRPEPPELAAFLAARRLTIEVLYSPAHPMVPTSIRPLDPEPDLPARTQHAWHLNGDGTLCLLQATEDWDPAGTSADLIVKAAGWFLEYELMRRGVITAMTERGLAVDPNLDRLLSPYIRCGA